MDRLPTTTERFVKTLKDQTAGRAGARGRSPFEPASRYEDDRHPRGGLTEKRFGNEHS